jgi:glycerophosphoryl diester phosphodiesterase
MESLLAAKINGSEMVEFDVRLTRDYVPVLYHDAHLKRLHKAPVNMQSLTFQQAKVFAANLTTLDEVLESKAGQTDRRSLLQTIGVSENNVEFFTFLKE